MAGLFETVTRVAIEEILRNHAQPSKFGLLVTPEAFQELTDDLLNLLVTSRELKAAGDRMVGGISTSPHPGQQNFQQPASKRGATR
jgi:hypothetical protein